MSIELEKHSMQYISIMTSCVQSGFDSVSYWWKPWKNGLERNNKTRKSMPKATWILKLWMFKMDFEL